MAYVSLAVSCEIYPLKFSCLLLLTLLLYFVLLLYSLALKFKNYSYRIDACVRHLNDVGALTVCHHIFTIMCNTTDDLNNIDIKVSFNAKLEIYIYIKQGKNICNIRVHYINIYIYAYTCTYITLVYTLYIFVCIYIYIRIHSYLDGPYLAKRNN